MATSSPKERLKVYCETSLHGMNVLLTWNCRHMANRFALPKTVAVVTKAGYRCPAIVTPENYLKEDLDE